MMLAPPDAEAAVVQLLSTRLNEVSTRIPNPRPDRHVRVTAAGGNDRNLVQADPRLLIECWAPNEGQAFADARLAYGLLAAAEHSFMTPGVWVGGVDLTVPVSFEDPSTGSSRYQFVVQPTLSKTEVS